MQLAFTNPDEKSFIIIDSFDFDFLLTLQCCCHPRFMVLAVAFETLQNCKVRPIVMAKPNTKKLSSSNFHSRSLGGKGEGGCLTHVLGNPLADGRMSFLCLLRRCGNASANGPNRLVGNDHLLRI